MDFIYSTREQSKSSKYCFSICWERTAGINQEFHVQVTHSQRAQEGLMLGKQLGPFLKYLKQIP